jgi:hypothetical protein
MPAIVPCKSPSTTFGLASTRNPESTLYGPLPSQPLAAVHRSVQVCLLFVAKTGHIATNVGHKRALVARERASRY